MIQQQTKPTHMYTYLLKKKEKEKEMGEAKILEMYTQIIQTNRKNSQYVNFMIQTIPQMFSL